jgi:hypothetical protein
LALFHEPHVHEQYPRDPTLGSSIFWAAVIVVVLGGPVWFASHAYEKGGYAPLNEYLGPSAYPPQIEMERY